ncbi:BICD family-like cargo adapter 1 [Balaenoptera acutorostrata]|uniref:BICD family-like cargo adapter 1 n=1 Tax=Balaenoptera acutorostrata TaxID=9767 RepID=A0ABM3RX75_BALAC|nr:BICD family-like cargo adapter 1 [Balaenoptera acutorostrata]
MWSRRCRRRRCCCWGCRRAERHGARLQRAAGGSRSSSSSERHSNSGAQPPSTRRAEQRLLHLAARRGRGRESCRRRSHLLPRSPGELEQGLEELALLAAGERPSDSGEHSQDGPGPLAEVAGLQPPPPPAQDPEQLSVIRQKDLVSAALAGKALLERNQDMSRQYEQMHKELTDKVEQLEQEKRELRRFENQEGEWEGREAELENDVKELQDELERQQVHLREVDGEKTQAVQELSEQNQRLLAQFSRVQLSLLFSIAPCLWTHCQEWN